MTEDSKVCPRCGGALSYEELGGGYVGDCSYCPRCSAGATKMSDGWERNHCNHQVKKHGDYECCVCDPRPKDSSWEWYVQGPWRGGHGWESTEGHAKIVSMDVAMLLDRHRRALDPGRDGENEGGAGG